MTEYKLDTLPKQLRIKSNMIYLGERIAFGSECELMDVAANEIEHLRELKSKYIKSALYAQDELMKMKAERDRYREALEVIVEKTTWHEKAIDNHNERISNLERVK